MTILLGIILGLEIRRKLSTHLGPAFVLTTKNMDLSFLRPNKDSTSENGRDYYKDEKPSNTDGALTPLKGSTAETVLTLYQCALGGGLVKLGLNEATDALYNDVAEMIAVD